MKRIVMKGTGGPEVFSVEEEESPVPTGRQVLVDIRAIGLNWSEVMIRRGEWPVEVGQGIVLGSEAAGIVEEVGEEVSLLHPGERVAVFDVTAYENPLQGTYADKILVDENRVLKIPPHVDFAQAASLPMALLTAFDALVKFAPLPASGNLVVTACTGAVGIAALQIGRLKGLRVVGTSRSEAKLPLIRNFGCDALAASDPSDLKDSIVNLLGAPEVDYVFDPIQGPTASHLLEIIGGEGTYVIYGALGGTEFTVPASFLFHQVKIMGYVVLRNLAKPENMQRLWAEIYPFLEEKDITVPVAKTVPFPNAGEAQSEMEQHSHFGKVVMVR